MIVRGPFVMKALLAFLSLVLVVATGCSTANSSRASSKHIVLVAGKPSHAAGEHEFNAGCLLLKKCLDRVAGVEVVVYTNGWPTDPHAFDQADAIMLYMDGGAGHPAVLPERLQLLERLTAKGVGLACVHYAVEVPSDHGGPEFLRWLGGYFETYWSVNPTWEADFQAMPRHPITRGVAPFKIRDEWYYHMRFTSGLSGVTPILTATPPDSTRGTPGRSDSHGGNAEVQSHRGEPEHVAWAMQRPEGGRGFGFTGGHFHKNWADDNFRKIVLNGLLWVAGMEVPADGVAATANGADLQMNLDPKAKN